MDCFELWERLLAGLAPRRPEIDDGNLARKSVERDRSVARHVLHREVRPLLAKERMSRITGTRKARARGVRCGTAAGHERTWPEGQSQTERANRESSMHECTPVVSSNDDFFVSGIQCRLAINDSGSSAVSGP